MSLYNIPKLNSKAVIISVISSINIAYHQLLSLTQLKPSRTNVKVIFKFQTHNVVMASFSCKANKDHAWSFAVVGMMSPTHQSTPSPRSRGIQKNCKCRDSLWSAASQALPGCRMIFSSPFLIPHKEALRVGGMSTAQVQQVSKVVLGDPSEFRPEHRDPDAFRDFRVHNVADRVIKTYDLMHTNQTVEFVRGRMNYWMKFNHGEMTVMEILEKLNELVDESDPDIDVPNSYHAYQTAEGIRQYHPDKPWFQLTGLLHDIGKIMHLWGEPQWATVGDTFVVGCAPEPSIVFGVESFSKNPDLQNPKYNTKFGMYSPNCGLDNVLMSWGHDEYLYRVLLANNHSLPEEALYMIRFHSFYPYHSCGAYNHLTNQKDEDMFPWIKEFNKFDLYTKTEELPNVDSLQPYYQSLIDQYLPGKIKW